MKSQTQGLSAIDLLLEAKRERKPIPFIPELATDLGHAYSLQKLLIDKVLVNGGGTTIGYKIACTNKRIQDLMGLSEPFYGRLLSQSSFPDGAALPTDDFIYRCIEAEFGIQIAKDLPARLIEQGEIAEYVGALLPVIEIVDSRYTDWLKVDALSHIVDNACHGAWVKGAPCTNWQRLDLSKQKVKLFVNDQLIREGSGEAVLGNPLNVLTWLANELHKNDLTLKAGEYLSTGVTTDVYFAKAGDRIKAEFGEIGQVQLSFTS